MNRIENSIQMNSGHRSQKASEFPQFDSRSSIESNLFGWLFNFLKSVDWKTVAMAVTWPLIIRLAFYVARKIKLIL